MQNGLHLKINADASVDLGFLGVNADASVHVVHSHDSQIDPQSRTSAGSGPLSVVDVVVKQKRCSLTRLSRPAAYNTTMLAVASA